MIFFVQLLAIHFLQEALALGTLHQSTSSCYGVTDNASNFMLSMCPTGEVIAIQSFTIAYKAAALNCTRDSVRDQNQFEQCCSSIDEEDCQMTYNFEPKYNVLYKENCNGKPSCNVMATVVPQVECSGVPDHYPNYMHMNYHCIPETSILSSISGTITSSSPGQSVYLQSPGFKNGQKIPSGENLTCSIHTCDIGSTLSMTNWQIVMEYKDRWNQCQQKLIVRRSDGSIIYDWQCLSNTATPETLQTSEQYLTIHLENTLLSNLGSFWLGFAGSSADSRVTVSCPPPETKPCVPSTTDSTSTPMTTTATTATKTDSASTPMTTNTTAAASTDSTSTPMTTTTPTATATDSISTPLTTTTTTSTTTYSISTPMMTTTTTATTTYSISTPMMTTTTTATTTDSTSTPMTTTTTTATARDSTSTPVTTTTTTNLSTTTLESTTFDTFETSSTPERQKGFKKEVIGIVVGGVTGFGLIALVLSIVFIRGRMNMRKATQNTNSESSTQRAHLPTSGASNEKTNGTTNPGNTSVTSKSTYVFIARIPGDESYDRIE